MNNQTLTLAVVSTVLSNSGQTFQHLTTVEDALINDVLQQAPSDQVISAPGQPEVTH